MSDAEEATETTARAIGYLKDAIDYVEGNDVQGIFIVTIGPGGAQNAVVADQDASYALIGAIDAAKFRLLRDAT